MAGGAVYDSRRFGWPGRGGQLKLSRLGSCSRSVCRLIPTPPAVVSLPDRAAPRGWAGVLIGGSWRSCRRIHRLGPAEKRIVLLCLDGLSFLLDLVRRAEVPTTERFTLQACGIDWAESHACSPSDMAAPHIASWASRKRALAADGPLRSRIGVAWPCCGALSAQRRVARGSDRRGASVAEGEHGVKNKIRTWARSSSALSGHNGAP